MKKQLFFLVDDDPMIIELLSYSLKKHGYDVVSTTTSVGALEKIIKEKPYCVIVDIMMPGIDGLSLCKQIKQLANCQHTKVLIYSAKHYDADQQHGMDAGADGYIVKAQDMDATVKKIQSLLNAGLSITFWGVRGSLPIPGKDTLKYGGNTSCVSVKFPNDSFLIFDCGTGIRVLGEYLLANYSNGITAKVMITHAHWDHINAIPFFAPLYVPGNIFEICGPSQGSLSIKDVIERQMDTIFFPVKTSKFNASISYRDLNEETLQWGKAIIKTKLLSHPGKCLGYRLEYEGNIICYISDNELYSETDSEYNAHYHKELKKFIAHSNVLIIDCSYSDQAYLSKKNWGHSCPSQVCKLATEAKVDTLYLYHHDYQETDDDVDNKFQQALDLLKSMGSNVRCYPAKEGVTIKLPMETKSGKKI